MTLNFINPRGHGTMETIKSTKDDHVVAKKMIVVIVAGLLLCSCHQEVKKSYLKRREYEKSDKAQTFQRMTYSELKKEKERLAKKGDYFTAVRYVGQMIKNCSDPDELRALRLEYADMLFYLGKHDEASQEYQQFAQLYPSSEKAAYAEFQSMNAMCKLVPSPDRDQEKAKAVVDSATAFGKKVQRADYKAYEQRVTTLAENCLRKLYESDVLRFYFYLNRSQFKAAQGRLKEIRDHYLKYVPALEPNMLELEYDLAVARNDKKQTSELKKTLSSKFPQYVMHPNQKRGYASVFYEML